MGSKTVTMHTKPEGAEETAVAVKPLATLGIQSDVAFSEATKRLVGRDLCSIADLSVQEMAAVMELAHAVKNHPEDFRHALDARQMVMFFEKASLRTRVTFEAGINTLGGNAIFVDQTQSPLGERESLSDMAHNLERWMAIMVLRTYSHDTITEMAACSRIPVINALSDLEHPCQAIADFFTLEERFGSAEGLHFTYVGDGNNVCHSLMLTAAQLGAHCTVATPKGFAPKSRHHPQGHRDRRIHRRKHHPHERPRQGRHRGRRRLHRRLHQHGLRARSHQARPHLQALPGQRSPDVPRASPTPPSCTVSPPTATPR